MAEYIEREAVTAMLKREFSPRVMAYLVDELCKIPAADVRPVVLCRDCVHYEMGVCLKIYDDGATNKDAWQERKPDDYCSYGEDRNVPANCGADMREES